VRTNPRPTAEVLASAGLAAADQTEAGRPQAAERANGQAAGPL
jgi:hypothetical protein